MSMGGKKMECSKRQNFKICKMSMGGNDTHRNKLIKKLNVKMKYYETAKEKKTNAKTKKKKHYFIKTCKRGK